MRIMSANKGSVGMAVRYLGAGKSVVYPTDTAYGLAVDATNVNAVKKLFKIKQRKNQPVHVVVSGFRMAKKYAKFTPLAEKLFKKFLPGPLTLVLESRITDRESWKILSAGTGTIGIRMPKNSISLALAKKLGGPITTTSANPAKGKTPYSIQDCTLQFWGEKHQPDLCLDAGKLPKTKPSTIIKMENGKYHILRKGPITKKQIEKTIAQWI